MPRFADKEREELFDEYLRLKAQNISDAQIARRFGVSQMTIMRWKQRYKLTERPLRASDDHEGTVQARMDGLSGVEGASVTRRLPNEVRRRDFPGRPRDELDDLNQEIAWLRELAGRLLLENERLRATLAGRLQYLRDE